MSEDFIQLADEAWFENRPCYFTVPARIAELEKRHRKREQPRGESHEDKEGEDDDC